MCKKECVTAAGFQMNHAGEKEREERKEFFFYYTAKTLGIYYHGQCLLINAIKMISFSPKHK